VKAKRPSGFLNVDLEIASSSSLEPLTDEMGEAVLVLYSGPGKGKGCLLCLESSRWPNTPNASARDLCRAVERLSVRARRVWDRARRKEFNVGYELRTGVRAVQVTLRAETVRRIVALGATVAFTCYRDDNSAPVDGGKALRFQSGAQGPPPLSSLGNSMLAAWGTIS
jgi:hypothetical protein